MARGDPVQICRPVRTPRGLSWDWFPATIADIDADSIAVICADHSRHVLSLRQSGYVIREMRRG